MASFLLHHVHTGDECGVAFASFKGHDSPLRRQAAIASCLSGGHESWWTGDAPTENDALAMLPAYVADRTTAIRVGEVRIP